MTFILEDEKEFTEFLNSGLRTGVFKLKLKLVRNKKVYKSRMVLYTRKENNIILISAKSKEGRKEVAVYSPEENTIYVDEAKKFVSLHLKFCDRELYRKSINHSQDKKNPNILQQLKEAEKEDHKDKIEIKNNDFVSNSTQDILNEQDRNLENRTLELENLLKVELKDAKKIWAIVSEREEVQVENSIFVENESLYLGTKRKNVKLSLIESIKYRGRTYPSNE